jgi:hypothetical protein
MGRMNAKQLLGFLWHALPLTFVRKSAPEMGMRRIRLRNEDWRNSFGIVSERHPIYIRILSDSFTRPSRHPTGPLPTQET